MDLEERERRAKICAEEHGGLLCYVEAFYVQSIIYSASRCLDALTRYDTLKEDENTSADVLVSLVQEAVGHSAALSRYFWPSPQGSKKRPNLAVLKEERGKTLRQAFLLDENSPLFSRDLRNAWEHFDERLDDYFLENEAGYFFPGPILDTHQLADDPVGHVFKLLDVKEECLVLLGRKYFFSPIRVAVQEVFELAVNSQSRGLRIQRR